MGCHVEAKPKHLKIFTTRDSSPAKQVQNDIVSLREALASRQSNVLSVHGRLIASSYRPRNDTKTRPCGQALTRTSQSVSPIS